MTGARPGLVIWNIHRLREHRICALGDTAEVGAFGAYLAGPATVYTTGASLNIDGGFGA